MFSMILVYLFLTVPSLSIFFGAVTIVSGVMIAGTGLYCADQYDWTPSKKSNVRKSFKIFIPILLICGFITAAIPTKETSYAMAAAYVAQEAVQSELGQAAIALLQANVDSALAELKK